MSQQGPSFPTTATGNTTTFGGGAGTWTNPTNIEANDGNFATFGLGNSATTADLIGEGFGFSIPGGATILGIQLAVNGKTTVTTQNGDSTVKLLKAGTAVGNNKALNTNFGTVGSIINYGSSSDLWGTTWTPSDINNSTFGAVWTAASGPSGSCTISVDYFTITVTFSLGATGFLMFMPTI